MKEGASEGAHLRQAAKALGRDLGTDIEPEPDFPVIASHIWGWFLDLNPARQTGAMGPGAITYESIEVYSRMHRLWMRPWEVSALRAVDDCFLAVASETTKERQERKKREQESKARAKRR